MSKPQAVVFDLDGTLLDTLEDLADAMNQVLADQGLPPHPAAAYKGFVGHGVETLVRRAVEPRLLDDIALVETVRAMQRVYRRRGDPKTRPYPGVPRLLDGLVARGVTLAVLSNKPDDAVQRLASRLLCSWPFARIWGARPEVSKKPDPAGALGLARELQIPPARWLFLGDTGVDMQTARAAGMTAVGVLWGFRSADELLAAGAEELIARPADLLPLL